MKPVNEWSRRDLDLLEDGYRAAKAAQDAANRAAYGAELERALKLEAEAIALIQMVATTVPGLIQEIRRLRGWDNVVPFKGVH